MQGAAATRRKSARLCDEIAIVAFSCIISTLVAEIGRRLGNSLLSVKGSRGEKREIAAGDRGDGTERKKRTGGKILLK
jgi:hypothetical protein